MHVRKGGGVGLRLGVKLRERPNRGEAVGSRAMGRDGAPHDVATRGGGARALLTDPGGRRLPDCWMSLAEPGRLGRFTNSCGSVGERRVWGHGKGCPQTRARGGGGGPPLGGPGLRPSRASTAGGRGLGQRRRVAVLIPNQCRRRKKSADSFLIKPPKNNRAGGSVIGTNFWAPRGGGLGYLGTAR